ncbi:hypothetical protein KVT40_006556 [Elsinoe batatas]|uniref:Uncharacterized protein n=1 Tax=Elsinoe batatas TaxID=2601811 RepID=A0A8K0L2B1_9PEZI|nr:hypothetical protein KVT40_006556 [Elsinoe batatas]
MHHTLAIGGTTAPHTRGILSVLAGLSPRACLGSSQSAVAIVPGDVGLSPAFERDVSIFNNQPFDCVQVAIIVSLEADCRLIEQSKPKTQMAGSLGSSPLARGCRFLMDWEDACGLHFVPIR